MRRVWVVLAVLCGAWVSGAAAVQAQGAGAFARMGFGARGLAMSNALVADGFGGASPYYNPALAPYVGAQNLEASAALLRFDRELQFLQFATPLEPRAGAAAGLIHAGVSDIDGRDASGYHTQTFSTDEFAFFLAFGLRFLERASAGIALQLFRADYAEGVDPTNSLGLDLGLSLRVTEALHLGVAVDDLLARYNWDTSSLFGEGGRSTTDRFPARIRVGAGYQVRDGLAKLLVEYESMLRATETSRTEVVLFGDTPRQVEEREDVLLHDSRLRLGAEVQLAEPFAVRAGVDRLFDDDVSAATPSAGFMVAQPIGELDVQAAYAFVLEPYAVGTMHLLSLRIFL